MSSPAADPGTDPCGTSVSCGTRPLLDKAGSSRLGLGLTSDHEGLLTAGVVPAIKQAIEPLSASGQSRDQGGAPRASHASVFSSVRRRTWICTVQVLAACSLWSFLPLLSWCFTSLVQHFVSYLQLLRLTSRVAHAAPSVFLEDWRLVLQKVRHPPLQKCERNY